MREHASPLHQEHEIVSSLAFCKEHPTDQPSFCVNCSQVVCEDCHSLKQPNHTLSGLSEQLQKQTNCASSLRELKRDLIIKEHTLKNEKEKLEEKLRFIDVQLRPIKSVRMNISQRKRGFEQVISQFDPIQLLSSTFQTYFQEDCQKFEQSLKEVTANIDVTSIEEFETEKLRTEIEQLRKLNEDLENEVNDSKVRLRELTRKSDKMKRKILLQKQDLQTQTKSLKKLRKENEVHEIQNEQQTICVCASIFLVFVLVLLLSMYSASHFIPTTTTHQNYGLDLMPMKEAALSFIVSSQSLRFSTSWKGSDISISDDAKTAKHNGSSTQFAFVLAEQELRCRDDTTPPLKMRIDQLHSWMFIGVTSSLPGSVAWKDSFGVTTDPYLFSAGKTQILAPESWFVGAGETVDLFLNCSTNQFSSLVLQHPNLRQPFEILLSASEHETRKWFPHFILKTPGDQITLIETKK